MQKVGVVVGGGVKDVYAPRVDPLVLRYPATTKVLRGIRDGFAFCAPQVTIGPLKFGGGAVTKYYLEGRMCWPEARDELEEFAEMVLQLNASHPAE